MSRLATSGAAVLVAVAVMAGTVVVGDARAESRGAQPCTPYTAIFAPGTWETRSDADPRVPVGMLRPIGDGLQRRFGGDITVLYAPYAASAFDQGLSYAESLSTLESRLHTMVRGLCGSTRVILAGYSQGADGIGDLATEIGNGEGPISADRVVGVGLLADPHRDPDTTLSLGDPQPGRGIAGTRGQDFGALTDRVRTLCADGDLYCSLNATASPFLAALGRVLSGDPSPIADLIPAASDPRTLIAQSVKVGAGWAATAANLPTILDDLTDLPNIIQTGDIRAAHQIASNLNAALSPMVQAAAGVDLPLIASVIRAAGAVDPSGWTAAASVLADVLTRIDILRIAGDVGQLQESLWRAVESLTRQDPVAVAVEMATLTPTALDLAGSVIGPFATAVRGDLRVAAQTLLSIGGPDCVNDLVQLSRQGVAMARFYVSNAHIDYGDDAQILLNFLGSQVIS
ncbi:cutinase family protein [Nocardia sp. SYP-A9097]|uniref:cutinase family protein n=1 Tax=Nocardia sp. SYP-A9097 TaxID=2663237 RepID=UPI00129A123E|nr:cutinase family protein [Nocardia sp. SYP-A9097]MRH87279.1 cutinase family protein [Nocardia sp. SYP-A9097]